MGRGKRTTNITRQQEPTLYLGARELPPPKYTGRVVYPSGPVQKYYKDGLLHRDGDKPAIIYGYDNHHGKEYYKDGLLHRDGDKPAIECRDGTKMWYKDDKHHRDGDKPAIEWMNGDREWWLLGLEDREGDKPAFEGSDGKEIWYEKGLCHRLTGPAVINPKENSEEYWIWGRQMKKEKWEKEAEVWLIQEVADRSKHLSKLAKSPRNRLSSLAK